MVSFIVEFKVIKKKKKHVNGYNPDNVCSTKKKKLQYSKMLTVVVLEGWIFLF